MCRVCKWVIRKSFGQFFFSLKIYFLVFFPRFLCRYIFHFSYFCALADFIANLLNISLVKSFVKEHCNRNTFFNRMYGRRKIRYNNIKQTKHKNTCCHRGNRCKRKHLIAPYIFNSLLDGIKKCINPHRNHHLAYYR